MSRLTKCTVHVCECVCVRVCVCVCVWCVCVCTVCVHVCVCDTLLHLGCSAEAEVLAVGLAGPAQRTEGRPGSNVPAVVS